LIRNLAAPADNESINDPRLADIAGLVGIDPFLLADGVMRIQSWGLMMAGGPGLNSEEYMPSQGM